jgi:hypothetical protein
MAGEVPGQGRHDDGQPGDGKDFQDETGNLSERQESWEFGYVARDAPRLIHRENVGCVGICFESIAAIDVSERLAVGVLHHVGLALLATSAESGAYFVGA